MGVVVSILQRTGKALAIALVVLAGTSEANYTAINVSPVTVSSPLTTSGFPTEDASCIVTGYSLHAQEQMAARGITSDEVENVVYYGCDRAVPQSNGTYRYDGQRIGVSVNPAGYVVTAYVR
jgi:hypothetical protein